MTGKVTPETARRISVVFRAMVKTEHAGELLGSLYAFREVLFGAGIDLADLAAWIERWAVYDANLRDDAVASRDAIWGEISEIELSEEAAAVAKAVAALDG